MSIQEIQQRASHEAQLHELVRQLVEHGDLTDGEIADLASELGVEILDE